MWQQEQEKFAERQKEYLIEKQKEDQITEHRTTRTKELRKILSRGPISDFDKVMRRRVHLNILKEELDKQVEKVVEASEKVEEQRENVTKALKDRKILEKNKERKFKEYTQIMNQLETQFLDEIATTRFQRQKV